MATNDTSARDREIIEALSQGHRIDQLITESSCIPETVQIDLPHRAKSKTEESARQKPLQEQIAKAGQTAKNLQDTHASKPDYIADGLHKMAASPEGVSSARVDFQEGVVRHSSQDIREDRRIVGNIEIEENTGSVPRASYDALSTTTTEESTLGIQQTTSMPTATQETLPVLLFGQDNIGTKKESVAFADDQIFSKKIEKQKQIVKELLDSLVPFETVNTEIENEALVTETDIKAENDSFIQNFVEQIRVMPPIPEKTAKEQPATIMSAVLEKAADIQAAENTEEITPKVLEKMKAELEVLCVELLESLGIEPDKKTIAALIEKIVTADLSALLVTKLTPQELAHLGTHEYKLEDWFRKFKRLIDESIHPHQLVGRVAISLSVAS